MFILYIFINIYLYQHNICLSNLSNISPVSLRYINPCGYFIIPYIVAAKNLLFLSNNELSSIIY